MITALRPDPFSTASQAVALNLSGRGHLLVAQSSIVIGPLGVCGTGFRGSGTKGKERKKWET